MSKIRTADWGQVQAVQGALEHLLKARFLLRYADAPKTLERTLLAISSCKGALRHAGHRAARTPTSSYQGVTIAEAVREVQTPARPLCSVCEDDPARCSHNYSGGWVDTPCPKHY